MNHRIPCCVTSTSLLDVIQDMGHPVPQHFSLQHGSDRLMCFIDMYVDVL